MAVAVENVQVRWRGAACFQLFRRFRPEEHRGRSPSQVDSQLLLGDSDRLLAGVARLFYRHVEEGEAFVSAGLQTTSCENKGRGVLLTAADFDEVNFTGQANCKKRFSLSRLYNYFWQPALIEQIYSLLKNIAALSEFKKEMAVLAAIYTERLLKRHPTLRLTKRNWRPLLIAALHLASKTWEDVHAWNSDLSAYLRVAIGLDYPVRCLHRLELLILTGLDYRIDISGELYASYYFALTEEIQRKNTPPQLLNESLLASSLGHTVEATSTMASERDIQSLCGSPTPSSSSHRVPWSRFFMSARTRRMSRTSSLSTCLASQPEEDPSKVKHRIARLDAQNPFVGYIRHAPQASAPSPYISKVASQKHQRKRDRAATTLWNCWVSWQLAVDSMLLACKSTVRSWSSPWMFGKFSPNLWRRERCQECSGVDLVMGH